MLSAGSGRGLPVKHLLDTLVTLLKRACVRDFAVVMKLSTASRTRVMDWTSVCVYDWMCLRVQRGRAGLRVTVDIHACIHGCAHVYVVCTRMYTRARAHTHTKDLSRDRKDTPDTSARVLAALWRSSLLLCSV